MLRHFRGWRLALPRRKLKVLVRAAAALHRSQHRTTEVERCVSRAQRAQQPCLRGEDLCLKKRARRMGALAAFRLQHLRKLGWPSRRRACTTQSSLRYRVKGVLY